MLAVHRTVHTFVFVRCFVVVVVLLWVRLSLYLFDGSLSVNHTPISVQPVALSAVHCSPTSLASELVTSYVAEVLIHRSASLIGSFELLGNPTKLVEEVTSGFVELISIPMSSVKDGYKAFMW